MKRRPLWRIITDDAGLPVEIRELPGDREGLDWDINFGRASRTRLRLSRLPGLRALGFQLCHNRSAAACAVWETVSTRQVHEAVHSANIGKEVVMSDDLDAAVAKLASFEWRYEGPIDYARRDDIGLVWIFPASEIDEWRRHGLGDCDHAEYCRRVEGLIDQCEKQGVTVVCVEATVAEMRAMLRRCAEKRNVTEALERIFMERIARE